jgi:hypothetical protein
MQSELGAKQLGLLHEFVPSAARFAVAHQSGQPEYRGHIQRRASGSCGHWTAGNFHRMLYPGTPETSGQMVVAFRKGLSETGYVEGRNVAIEFRSVEAGRFGPLLKSVPGLFQSKLHGSHQGCFVERFAQKCHGSRF